MKEKNVYIGLFTLSIACLMAVSTAKAGVVVKGNVYGGGNQADVQTNTVVNIGAGQVDGNVYGGGNLGDVGTIDKSDTDYNYKWKQTDGSTGNVAENNKITGANANTGICTVNITGGTIGVEKPADATKQGNVFGAGRGSAETWWCEKAIVYATNVSVSAGTVKGTVYGGGEVGRVEDDAKVTIGAADAADGTAPIITGNVFGAGAGLVTHGYSALVRGNAAVTVQGTAQVGGSVYGGGETASVGRFTVVGGLPKHPDSGGYCTVTIKDNAKIGTSGTGHNVYGACKGVTPAYVASGENRSKSMQLRTNAPSDNNLWSPYNNDDTSPFIWRYYATEEDYKAFLRTLALTSHPTVTINESATVYGSVYGGGERGLTLGNVDVNITGGTVEQDVYGGGALADTNAANANADSYAEATVTAGETLVTGMYTRSGEGTDEDPYVYTEITAADTKAEAGTTYYTTVVPSTINTTSVDLTGGLIKGDAYGGGLGQKNGFNGATSDIAATVYGDINVTLNGTAFNISNYDAEGHTDVVKSGRVFGCNNLLGSPQGDVKVTVWKTVAGNFTRTTSEAKESNKPIIKNNPDSYETAPGYVTPTYEVAAVYGGGNLANFTATGKKASVRIETCDVSIRDVYGGGNAAEVPETYVLVRGAYEIYEVFGGGNGKDPYTTDGGTVWVNNPGANIGNTTTPGNATTLLTGGYVHEAYGGSNKRGTIYGNVSIDMQEGSAEEQTLGACTLEVEKLVGAGKNADVNGDLIMVMDCKPDVKTPVLYAGADNANVNGDVELTITSGKFGKVFGGNNQGGIIMGHIKLNIEETGDCETPIEIDELYLGGNEAAYSMYGYYKDGDTYRPRTAAMAAITDPTAEGYTQPVTSEQFEAEVRKTVPYAAPELNIVSCTYIGKVFGGGYGSGAAMYANPTVNINMIKGTFADNTTKGVPAKMDEMGLPSTENTEHLGIIGDVFGGGNAADVYGSTTVNICTVTTVQTHLHYTVGSGYTMGDSLNVIGAYITGMVFGGGNQADVKGNATVNMAGGYVKNRIFGGGNLGSVGTYTTTKEVSKLNYTHTTHEGCIGKPDTFTEGTGVCTVKVSGGQVGPTGMKMPNDFGYVFGASRGETKAPALDPDIDFRSYVYDTYVTISGQAFITGGVYGGSENGRVRHDTHVKIEGGQIGVGANKETRYAEEKFIDPTTTPVTESNALEECSSWPYGKVVDGKKVYLPSEDADDEGSDGHTFYGNVFGGGSGFFPYSYEEGGKTKYEWLESAGEVEGDTYVDITGGHILTSVYGGNELTDVKGTCHVEMTGGTLGVPRTLEQIAAHPVTCYLFGAGKGDQRVHFNQRTNVGNVEVTIGGTALIYGSVFGGGEDGHVLGDVELTVKETAIIGTWGTSYVDGNVFGGGRGFGGDALTAGVVGGNVDVDIKGGTILGSIYGGGRLGSVGTYLVPSEDPNYGKMIPDGKKQVLHKDDVDAPDAKHGYVTINISGGTIGNSNEYVYNPSDDLKLGTLKQTMFDVNNRLVHTKGGNVFAGAMGRLYGLDGTTILSSWTDLGKVRHAKVNISGGIIKSNVYGGGELGTVTEGTEIKIEGGTIGTKIMNGKDVAYSFGSVYGGGYGSEVISDGTSIDKGETTVRDHAGLVFGSCSVESVTATTHVQMSGGEVMASVFGGGELALVDGDTDVRISGGFIGVNQDGMGGATMGNVFGGGKGSLNYVKAGLITGNTNVTVSGDATIYHNIYGGGADGSVGLFTYELPSGSSQPVGTPSSCTGGGTANVKITGGIIGINGHENGMVFGSSRGDVEAPDNSGFDPNNKLAWVNETNVTIGTSGSSTGPDIRGSVYGSGENGHVLNDTHVNIHGGKIGVVANEFEGEVIGGLSGAAYSTRGNVYGGGCGTDTYQVTTGTGVDAVTKTYFNRTAGIVRGNTYITMDGGHVVRNIYGGGAMGSVGTLTRGDKPAGEAEDANVPGPITACADNTGKCTITISGGEVGPDSLKMPLSAGHVFGAGRGQVHDPALYPNLERVVYVNNTEVTVKGTAFIKGSVYGGSESGHVLGNTNVKIQGGQIGMGRTTKTRTRYPESVFTSAPLETSDWECPSWTYDTTDSDGGKAYDMYADTEGYDAKGGVTTATDGHTFYGNVFGGGSGYTPYAAGKWLKSAGVVKGNATVEITGGHILTNVYGGNECTDVEGKCTVTMSGGTVGVPRTDALIRSHPVTCYVFGAGKGDKRVLFNTWTNVAETEVIINGGTIFGSVLGGGEDGHVLGNAVTTIEEKDEKPITIGSVGTSGADGNVFGGGRGSRSALTAGVVGGNITLNIKSGTIKGCVYGGGRMASVGTHFTNPADPGYGVVTNDEDHGNITVNLTGGTIGHDVYGGCMGATGTDQLGESRSVKLHLNKDVGTDQKGCIIGGYVFGCNNVNSSPRLSSLVHIHATQNKSETKILDKNSDYDLKRVFGGGNQADFVPTLAGSPQTTEVIIEGCGLTSVEEVYGGGYGAATPGTKVSIRGTHIINNVFGGGYGAGVGNPGANVGYRTDKTEYGKTGTDKVAIVELMAGKVNNVYGGSNTKGDIRNGASITNVPTEGTSGSNAPCCETLTVGKIYGGGKDAEMAGGAEIVLGCMPNDWIEEIYAGAQNADVGNDVMLTLTSGKFGRVFGGNKSGGRLHGSITVNIEENGACGTPVIIGELYAGGNLAPYSIYGYYQDGTDPETGRPIYKPRTKEMYDAMSLVDKTEEGIGSAPHNSPILNVRAFTSIGNIFGGGYGEEAVMVGSPTVNINEVKFDKTTDGYQSNAYAGETKMLKKADGTDDYNVTLIAHEDGEMGVIGNVYGGGNAAKVIGDTHVHIGTKATEKFESDKVEKTVSGADIRGNVYGGGNNAEVTGNTDVQIGQAKAND